MTNSEISFHSSSDRSACVPILSKVEIDCKCNTEGPSSFLESKRTLVLPVFTNPNAQQFVTQFVSYSQATALFQ